MSYLQEFVLETPPPEAPSSSSTIPSTQKPSDRHLPSFMLETIDLTIPSPQPTPPSLKKPTTQRFDRLFDYLPKISNKPVSGPILMELAERTRAGKSTFQELKNRGARTRGYRYAKGTIVGKKTALNWVTKFVKYCNLESEILDLHELGAQTVRGRLDSFLCYLGDMIDGSSLECGLGLPGTAARYASQWLEAHLLLPIPIDLSWAKDQITAWRKGRARELTEGFGIIQRQQKCGISRDQMEGLYDLDWAEECELNLYQVLNFQSMGQVAFHVMLRRAEISRAPGVTFNPLIHMTRGDIVWYFADGTRIDYNAEGNLDPRQLLRLYTTLEGRGDLTVKTSKADQSGAQWSSNLHPLVLRKPEENAVIKSANYLLLREILMPCLSKADRDTTPLFNRFGTKDQETSYNFDKVIIKLLHTLLNKKGRHLSMAQVRKMYSLHSFRIGGVNALRAAGVPREIRMILGRWKSDAIDVYSRTDVELFGKYLMDQGISCPELQTLAEDMPQHEDAVGRKYGEPFDIETINGVPEPLFIPEITLEEATSEMRVLAQASRAGTDELSLSHSLVGRQLEVQVSSSDDTPIIYRGEVIQAQPLVADHPFVVQWEGGGTERVSISAVCDNLVQRQQPRVRPPPPPPPAGTSPS